MEKELVVVKSQVSEIKKELERLNRLEKSLAYHEIVLLKKARDMNELESKLEKFAKHEHLADIRKELKKVAKHDDLLFESSRYIRELVREIEKVRLSHELSKDQGDKKLDKHRQEQEEATAQLRKEVSEAGAAMQKRRVEILGKINHVELELHDRLSQVEYQNRLIIKYLKTIDEKIFNSSVQKKQ